jgi:type I restriction enzyme S subunit
VSTVEFGTLFRFIRNGMNVKQDKSGDGLPITRIETISDATVDETRVGFAGLEEAHCRDWFLETGDILFSHINSVEHIGKCAVYRGKPEKLVHGMNLLCLRSDTAKLLPEFAKYLMRGTEFRARLSSFINKAVNQASVSIGNLKTIPVTMPPLAEQRRIAEVLDRAEALRAKRRAALAQLDALTQSLFLDLFGDPITNPKGWPRIEFGKMLDNIDSGWSPTCLDRPVADKEWGVLKLGAVTWCRYNSAENKALPPDVEPDSSIEVKAGDLLFARKNTYELVAACALVRETPPRLMMSDLMFRLRLRPDAKLDPTFLQQLLIYPTKRREIQKFAGGSAGSMPNISKARLKTTPIEAPPFSLQREFARRVVAVEALKTKHRASLAELDALFATLQHRAFRGEL